MLVDEVSVALRALSFIAVFQAAGAALFVALFGRFLTHTAGTTRRFGVLSAVAAIVLVLAHYGLEPARMSGDFAGVLDSGMREMVLHSPSSVVCVLRVIGLALIIVGLMAHGPAVHVLNVIGALTTVVSFTFMGHTMTHSNTWLLRGLLFLHLLVVAFWFGALVPLAAASTRESPPAAGAIVTAFSKLAVWWVPALFVAGFLVGAILLRSLAGLSTPYGRLLLAKACGFALLMIPAAINKWLLGDALARGKPDAAASFRVSVAVEYVLIASVLAITATMTTFFAPDE